MSYTIEIALKKNFRDRHGEHVRQDILDLGMRQVKKVTYYPVYRIDGDLAEKDARRVAENLLIDPVTHTYSLVDAPASGTPGKASSAKRHCIEVWLKPGVTDTVAESVVKAVRDMGIDSPVKVKTGHKYVIEGEIPVKTVRQIAERLLANPMIQVYNIQ